MIASTRSLAPLCVAACMAVFALGCANVPMPGSGGEGVSERRRDRQAELVQEYEQKRTEAHYQAALSRWQQGDCQGCRKSLEDLLARTPQHREARLLLAEVFLGEHNPAAAKQQLETVLASHPGDAQALDAMSLVSETIGQAQRAGVDHQSSMPPTPPGRAIQASYQQTLEAPSAATRFDVSAARRFDGSGGSISDDLATCARTELAAAALRRAAAAIRVGQAPTAVAELREAMAADPQNPQIPIRAALYALGLNQMDAAAGVLNDAVVRFPGSAGVHRLCGLALYRQGEYEASQVALQQALSLDNTDALSYFLLGHALKRQGQPEAAAQHFEQARRLDPTLALQR